MPRNADGVELSFNSAITGINETDGRWSEEAHKGLVLPLRGKVMQIDGVTGTNINRYNMTVGYFTDITDPEMIRATVQSAIDELIARPDSQLFPLRGDKQPTATLVIAPHQTKKSVVARFDTDLVVYTSDNNSWKQTQNTINKMLANLDGVRGYVVTLRELAIVFDTRYTTEELVKNHLASVLKKLTDKEVITDFFPFLKGNLDVAYRVVDKEVS